MATFKGVAGAMGLAAVLTAATGHDLAWCLVMAAMVPAGCMLGVVAVRALGRRQERMGS